MSLRRTALATLALAALPVAVLGTAAGASQPRLLPDDLAFLDSPAIDELVAEAENGLAECAALETVLGLAFISAFIGADWDFDFGDDESSEAPEPTEPQPTAELFWGTAAPLLVPLLDRAGTDDPVAASFVEVVGPQLVGAIEELRDLGFTDDDLLYLQESFAETMLEGDDAVDATDPEAADLTERLEGVVAYEFESITFLDEDADELPGGDDDAMPWEASCPETAAILDFDVEASVSATMDFEVPITAP